MNRSERRRLRTHLDLLVALRTELVRSGLDDLTVQAVTDRADVALGTFYNHFDDKNAAIDALGTMEIEAIRRRIRDVGGAEPAMPRFVSASCVVLIQHAAADREWIAGLVHLMEAQHWPSPATSLFHHELLRRSMPHLTPDEIAWRAALFQGSALSLCKLLAAESFTGPVSDRVEVVIRSVLAGLGYPQEAIDAEAEWASALPVVADWLKAEDFVTMDSLRTAATVD